MDAIEISNMAIGFADGSPITSFEDGSKESDLCKTFYPNARNYCLENRDWTFASDYKRLSPLTAIPAADFSTQFQLPSDCLVVRQVSDNPKLEYGILYQLSGNKLLTNHSVVYIRYTKLITDTSLFTPTFSIAVAHKLAEFISGPLTASRVFKNDMVTLSEGLLENGGAIDGGQGSPKRVYASRLLGARYGRGSNSVYDWGI
jgi:hypothetical protein